MALAAAIAPGALVARDEDTALAVVGNCVRRVSAAIYPIGWSFSIWNSTRWMLSPISKLTAAIPIHLSWSDRDDLADAFTTADDASERPHSIPITDGCIRFHRQHLQGKSQATLRFAINSPSFRLRILLTRSATYTSRFGSGHRRVGFQILRQPPATVPRVLGTGRAVTVTSTLSPEEVRVLLLRFVVTRH
jgi:hypothetical protein